MLGQGEKVRYLSCVSRVTKSIAILFCCIFICAAVLTISAIENNFSSYSFDRFFHTGPHGNGHGFIRIGPVTGEVTDATTGKPLKNIPVELAFDCTHDSGFPAACPINQILKTKTNDHGRFAFSVHSYLPPFPLFLILNVNPVDRWDSGSYVSSTTLLDTPPSRFDRVILGLSATDNGYGTISIFRHPSEQSGTLANFSRDYQIALVPNFSSFRDCSKIKDPSLQQACIHAFASRESKKIWPSIGPAAMGIMANYFNDYVDEMYQNELQGGCKNTFSKFCIAQSAIKNRSIQACRSLSLKDRQLCILRTAVETGDTSFCSALPLRTRDDNEAFFTDLYPSKCIWYTATRHRDTSLCEKLSETKTENYYDILTIDNCWEGLAFLKNDFKLCTHSSNPELCRPYVEALFKEAAL